MPLEYLVPLVVVGLTIIIGTVHLTGGSQRRKPLDPDIAQNRLKTDFPDFDAKTIVIDDAQMRAFLISGHGDEVGYVQSMGQHHLTRLLNPRSLASIAKEDGGLSITLNDPALPRIDCRISDPDHLTALTSALDLDEEAIRP